MIEAWAPGKLFIAGEYAVVEAGEPAVLVAVNRGIRARLEELPAARPAESSPHVREACRVVEQLRASRGLPATHYTLQIESDLEDQRGQKYGLGSSAAVTVAVVAALDALYGLELTTFQRFQLALLATLEISPKSSGGDLAVSSHAGWIRYVSPDRDAILAYARQHGISASLEDPNWQRCEITQLPAPDGLRLLVGWTGSPASTVQLVGEVHEGRESAEREHEAFVRRSRHLVQALVTGLENGGAGVPPVIRELRALLQDLGRTSRTEIETPMLRVLCEIAEQHGAAAKPSGAGGGDCGIVLAGSDCDTEAILREWKSHGIIDLDLTVQPGEGVFDER